MLDYIHISEKIFFFLFRFFCLYWTSGPHREANRKQREREISMTCDKGPFLDSKQRHCGNMSMMMSINEYDLPDSNQRRCRYMTCPVTTHLRLHFKNVILKKKSIKIADQ